MIMYRPRFGREDDGTVCVTDESRQTKYEIFVVNKMSNNTDSIIVLSFTAVISIDSYDKNIIRIGRMYGILVLALD